MDLYSRNYIAFVIWNRVPYCHRLVEAGKEQDRNAAVLLNRNDRKHEQNNQVCSDNDRQGTDWNTGLKYTGNR